MGDRSKRSRAAYERALENPASVEAKLMNKLHIGKTSNAAVQKTFDQIRSAKHFLYDVVG